MTSEPGMGTENERFVRALHDARRRSRGAGFFTLIGLIAIILALGTMTALINQQKHLAEQRAKMFETQARGANAVLEQARTAYEGRDYDRLGHLLNAAIAKTEALAQTAHADVAQAGPAASSPAPPTQRQRVFIQFDSAAVRDQVASLNKALRDGGWNVQGRVGELTPNARGYNEVRYSAEQDAGAAAALAKAVNDSGLSAAPITTRRLRIIKPGVLELWLSSAAAEAS